MTNYVCLIKIYGTRDSSVGIATCYGLDDRGSGVRFSARAGNFSPLHRVQAGSGAHPASYQMERGAFSPGVKRLGYEVDHSLPSSAEVKNALSYTSTPTMSSWRDAWLNTGQLTHSFSESCFLHSAT
jgi:hypothetical protein